MTAAAARIPVPIPGPRRIPLLGPGPRLLAFLREPAGYMEALHARYGDVVSLTRGAPGHVFLFGPEPIRTLLDDGGSFVNMDAASSPLRLPAGSSLSRLYGGLTTLNGPAHTRLRRIVRAALAQRDVEAYGRRIAAVAERVADGWRAGNRVDLLEVMRAATLEVAVATLLGIERERPGRAAGRLLDDWMTAVFSLPALALPVDLPGMPYRRLLRLSERLEDVIRATMAARRSEGPGGRDVLSRLMRAGEGGEGLTDDELVGQTAFLFMAGHATTASALTWTVLLLCAHPRVLADVRDELDAVLGGRAPDAGDLRRLDLLHRVVAESLRLLPPVMWWSRIAATDARIGPFDVPAGARVIYSPHVVHRRPDLYPGPRAFRPERWRCADRTRYAYLPFSAGVRSCLGAGFATVEISTILAVLLQRWQFEPRDGHRVDRGGLMVTFPRRGLPVTIRSRRTAVPPVRLRGSVPAELGIG